MPNLLRRHKKDAPKVNHQQRAQGVLSDDSPFNVVEAYKNARTNLMFLRNSDECQKIAVTSTIAEEGKSTNCVNLAITLGQNGLKVLIIDCDMRKPTIHKEFGLHQNDGLSEFLAGITDTQNGIVRKTKYQNVYVLPSGKIPPNPAELLASKRMKALLDKLSGYFDYIIMDTPPVTLVTDAAVLKDYVQGYIMIVRAERTTIDELKECVSRMKQLDANIIGFMLNDMNYKSGSQYKHYNNYYYYRYSRYGYHEYVDDGQKDDVRSDIGLTDEASGKAAAKKDVSDLK